MRIVAGDFKGRKIETPFGKDIRPTSEKVKEAVFSILYGDIDGAVAADLFTGTGNLGLEALSRGADLCYFSDNSRDSINITKRNIANCRAEEWSVLVPGDYERCLERIKRDGRKVDIFFIDPPYKEGLYERCFELIREMELLGEGGKIIAEHSRKDMFPDEMSGYSKTKERDYGSITISIYE